MADLLGLSARIIDSGSADEAVNRVTQELSELADGVALVESFSHIVASAPTRARRGRNPGPAQAAPDSREAHEIRARVYEARKQAESSLMAKGIFAGAASQSRTFLDQQPLG